MLIFLDMSIFFVGWLLAQILLNGYEAHVSLTKRAAKFAGLFVIFSAIHYYCGSL